MKNIKIKIFHCTNQLPVKSEEEINNWIKENDIDVVDIKYSVVAKEDFGRHVENILVIYKD